MNYSGLPEDEQQPYPYFIKLASTVQMIYSAASFLRNVDNTNIQITIPLGVETLPNAVWISPDIFLSDGTFNVTTANNIVSYPNNKDALISQATTLYHDILIQFKLTKSDGTNFINQRELRCTLVQADGQTQYSPAFFAYQEPSTARHENLLLKGSITQNTNDLVRIKFYLVQDNKNTDMSDTLLTIFRINWNIYGLTGN